MPLQERTGAVIPAVMPTYARADLAFERGEGAYLFATDGRRYLDFASGIAVTALGHAHPHLVQALTEQAQEALACLQPLPHPRPASGWPSGWSTATFADSVFFSNSGAEAIECGLKMVRKYHDETGHPERYRVITCRGRLPRPHAGDHRGRRPGEASEGLRSRRSTASTRSPSAI